MVLGINLNSPGWESLDCSARENLLGGSVTPEMAKIILLKGLTDACNGTVNLLICRNGIYGVAYLGQWICLCNLLQPVNNNGFILGIMFRN